ncbi:MAG: sugar ABC transporter substrate-binding protein [Epulopiscium sp.]|jgi:multiple sugar transport system substrate-binding protein|nr:sugar ABC transporter substrate-binding protein [Candidatus Epulonipiscium sp.]
MKAQFFKKCMAAGIACVMVGGVLAGCSKPAEPEATEDKTADATEAGEFDWKKYEGSSIQVSFVQHTIADAIVSKIPEFEEATGIKVDYSITPEANYFDKVSTSLSSRSGDPDLFMSGAYQLWDYSSAGFVEDLTPYIENMTTADYDFEDMVGSAVSALKWDGVPGHAVGEGAQLGLPLGFEIYSLAYNKRAFEQAGIEVPKTYDQLLEACDKLKEWNGSGSYALAIRGARDWGTIHPGYMSTYANFGAKDFEIEDNKLVSKVNSPEAVKMTEFWVDLIKRGGAPSWSKYTWYEAGADLGAGKAAMMFDADNNGVHQNWEGSSQEAGNIAWTVMPLAKEGDTPHSNYWTWSMAMNSASKNKEAAWYFLMYFTSKDFARYASVERNSLDPARTSVWEDEGFKEKMAKQEGYIETYEKTIDSTTILFTPQPYFFETTTEWAATLQDIVAGKYGSVQEGMDALKAKMDKAVSEIDLSQY